MTESNRKTLIAIHKAETARVCRELNKYKKKLTKKQLLKFTKFEAKRLSSLREFSERLGLDLNFTKSTIAPASLHYLKYSLLKMKKPKKPKAKPLENTADPYTCGPQYFAPQCSCHNSYYYDWSNDRR